MPQVLSKFDRPSSPPLSSPAGEVKKKRRIPSRWNKFKHRKKSSKEELQPRANIVLCQPPPEDEDWEKEIEAFSRRISQKEATKNQMPYDPDDELNVAVCEMTLYGVPRAPSPNQDHYSPSAQHVPPLKWIRFVYSSVVNQFIDAEE